MKHSRFSRRNLSRCLAVLGFPTLLGCSVIVDADREQCESDEDCRERGEAFEGSICVDSLCQRNPKWSCVYDEQPAAEPQAEIDTALVLMDLFTFGPVADVNVKLCGTLDLACLSPQGEGTSDEDGMAQLSLPANFDGYFQLESDKTLPMLYFPRLPIGLGQQAGTVIVPPLGALEALAGNLNSSVMEDRGLVTTLVYDCDGGPAIGTTVEYQGDMTDALPYFALQGTPSANATTIDDTGMTGVFNAVPGTLGMRFENSGTTIADISIMVREGFQSYREVYAGQSN